MTTKRKFHINVDSSDGIVNDEEEAGHGESPASKRRRIEESDFRTPSPDLVYAATPSPDLVYAAGSSSGEGVNNVTLNSQATTPRKRIRGQLRDMMRMPEDIFLEVCAHLNPGDLLRLTLTSNRIRDLLMKKNTRYIWRTALSSVPNLPECPGELDEPQYVRLLYSSHCFTIDCTSRGTKVDWFHRVLFCAACYDVKMIKVSRLRLSQQSLELGLQRSTLSKIQKYFDSSSVIRLAHLNRPSSSYLQRAIRENERWHYVENLKNYGYKYETLSGDEALDYLRRLKEEYHYRTETGVAMLQWKENQIASRADEIYGMKTTRFKKIKARLLAKGWSEEDFPMSNKEFKHLVYKNQELTDRIWRNIEPRLEHLLQTYWDERLNAKINAKIAQRRANRENAIEGFYRQLGREIMDLPFENHRLGSFLPETRAVLALPSVKILLNNDVETITEEQWDKVAPDVRLLVVVWWRDSLKRLVDMVEKAGRAEEADKEAQGEGSLETETGAASSIVALKAKLSFMRFAFRCVSSKCERRIWWFPDLIRHGSSLHACHNVEEVLNQLRPLPREGQELVERLLKDLDLDPETVRPSDANISNESHRNYLCTRCNESIARYMNFTELVEHYLDAKKCYDNDTKAAQYSQESSYLSQAMQGEFPNVVNDHDWISSEELLVREGDKAKEGLLKVQSDFHNEELNDSMCDVEVIGGEDGVKNQWREVLRCCLLCPASCAPEPCTTREIELHIQTRHDKQPDLETDTTLDIFYSINPRAL